MDPLSLKKEFGSFITFWGGGCNTITLTTKGPADVADEVKRNIEIFSNGGGYVFAPIHNITAEVSAENVIAMYEAASSI
jgi:uroporphyrinogen decarboxylase